ncbi:MAG TPA: Fic family protein, partial [Phycisphaerae bacterium]
MKPQDYKIKAAGRVIRAVGGYHAFVPAPLPPELNYDGSLVLQLSRADSALSELSGIGSQLPNPHLLIGSYTRREAVLSSRIEGTQTNMSELMKEYLAPGRSGQHADDVREVKNYVDALNHGIKSLDTLPLSLRLVCEIHRVLMEDVRGGHATPGEFRRTQNWIGPPGSTLANATYVPPPPEELMDALGAWEKFMHVRESLPDLIQCGLMHEQFEAIHPFLDGNGRVGRLMIILFLIERRRLTQPLLYLSAFFEKNRQLYYEKLQQVRTRGDWTGWLRFFLEGVCATATEAVGRARNLLDLREKYRSLLLHNGKGLKLLDALFTNPYVTAASAKQILQVTDPTARQTIAKLIKV